MTSLCRHLRFLYTIVLTFNVIQPTNVILDTNIQLTHGTSNIMNMILTLEVSAFYECFLWLWHYILCWDKINWTSYLQIQGGIGFHEAEIWTRRKYDFEWINERMNERIDERNIKWIDVWTGNLHCKCYGVYQTKETLGAHKDKL